LSLERSNEFACSDLLIEEEVHSLMVDTVQSINEVSEAGRLELRHEVNDLRLRELLLGKYILVIMDPNYPNISQAAEADMKSAQTLHGEVIGIQSLLSTLTIQSWSGEETQVFLYEDNVETGELEMQARFFVID
jgi:hypothetical protein